MQEHFVDTHCHLQLICEKMGGLQNLTKILDACQKAGVKKLLTLTAGLEELFSILNILEKYDFIYGAIGVHPHDAKEMRTEHFEFIQKHLHHPKITALGEIGLDYHYEFSPKPIQKEVFNCYLDLALKQNKAVIIHTREAEEDTKAILKNINTKIKGVIHCFTGTLEFAQFILANCPHLCLGFTGVSTFKNAEQIRTVIKETPIERIFIETDSPFMAPEPYRGKINNPSYIPLIANKISEIKEIELEEVLKITNHNSQYLFKG